MTQRCYHQEICWISFFQFYLLYFNLENIWIQPGSLVVFSLLCLLILLRFFTVHPLSIPLASRQLVYISTYRFCMTPGRKRLPKLKDKPRTRKLYTCCIRSRSDKTMSLIMLFMYLQTTKDSSRYCRSSPASKVLGWLKVARFSCFNAETNFETIN